MKKKYNIQLHPTFLFLDTNAKQLHKIVGVFNPDEFINCKVQVVGDD